MGWVITGVTERKKKDMIIMSVVVVVNSLISYLQLKAVSSTFAVVAGMCT